MEPPLCCPSRMPLVAATAERPPGLGLSRTWRRRVQRRGAVLRLRAECAALRAQLPHVEEIQETPVTLTVEEVRSQVVEPIEEVPTSPLPVPIPVPHERLPHPIEEQVVTVPRPRVESPQVEATPVILTAEDSLLQEQVTQNVEQIVDVPEWGPQPCLEWECRACDATNTGADCTCMYCDTARRGGPLVDDGDMVPFTRDVGFVEDENTVWTRPTTGLPARWKRLPWIHEYVQNIDVEELPEDEYVMNYMDVIGTEAFDSFFPTPEDLYAFQLVMCRLLRQTQRVAELQ